MDVPANVTVPDPMTADNVTVTAGEDQLLDGAEALVLARARKEYGDDQDALRQVNVRNIEAAIIGKVLESPNDEAVTAALLDLEENVTTNLDMAAAAFLVMDFVAHGDEVAIYSCTGPYEGGERRTGCGWWTSSLPPGTSLWRLWRRARTLRA